MTLVLTPLDTDTDAVPSITPHTPTSPLLTTYTVTPTHSCPTSPAHTPVYSAHTSIAYHSTILNVDILLYQHKTLGIAYQLWDSTAVLCTFVESLTQAYWYNKHVIELGAGCGTCSILLHKLGCNVDATDLDTTIEHLQHNIDINKSADTTCNNTINAIACNWGIELNDEIKHKQYDIIIGSDLLYWDTLFEPLLYTVQQLFTQSPNAIMYLAQTPRRHKIEAKFYKMLRKNNFDVTVVHTQKLKSTDRQHVSVYKVTRAVINAVQ